MRLRLTCKRLSHIIAILLLLLVNCVVSLLDYCLLLARQLTGEGPRRVAALVDSEHDDALVDGEGARPTQVAQRVGRLPQHGRLVDGHGARLVVVRGEGDGAHARRELLLHDVVGERRFVDLIIVARWRRHRVKARYHGLGAQPAIVEHGVGQVVWDFPLGALDSPHTADSVHTQL